MPTVKDIVVKKPSAAESENCKNWPIWTCEPSTFDWEYTEKETCLVLEGKVTVTDGSDSVTFGPGDLANVYVAATVIGLAGMGALYLAMELQRLRLAAVRRLPD